MFQNYAGHFSDNSIRRIPTNVKVMKKIKFKNLMRARHVA